MEKKTRSDFRTPIADVDEQLSCLKQQAVDELKEAVKLCYTRTMGLREPHITVQDGRAWPARPGAGHHSRSYREARNRS